MMNGMKRINMIVVVLGALGLLAVSGCNNRVPAESLAKRAHFNYWAGNWSIAQEQYAQLVDRVPDNWKYQFHLGSAALHNDDLDIARSSLSIAETLRPQDGRIASELAETMYRQDDRDALFTFLVDRAESTQRSDDWLMLARYSLDLDDPDMARLAIQEALVLDVSDSAEPYIVSAQLSERVGDIDGALKSLKIAWTLEPDNEKVQTMIRDLGEVPGPTMLGSVEMGG
ncbi:MAG: hypothetical protein CMJ40_03810 [Phycisphaerae bacterium]|nr:hypothetical protein [Phycisphaerae bacterium]|tara:strand:+ start:1089 stop:1772 length:684 start_codon:yes stop_codon:yes gene_type:complete